MSNKIQVRRGTAAGRPTFDSGEPGLDTDAVRAWIGTTEGNRELQMKGSTTDYTIYVATSALGGVSSASGATGKAIRTATATSTTANKLVDSTASFASATHLNKPVYNSTDDTWAKITAVDSTTQCSLSADIMASGEGYVISNAFDNIPDAFNVADAGYNANITIRASNGTFSNVLTLIGKTAGAAKTLTLQGSTTATTTVSGETSIYQKISLKNITFTKRIYEYFGADVDWTTCVTSGDDGFLLLKSTSVANVFRTSSVIVIENDPAVYTSISSTVTKGYTIYVATSTYGGSDAVGDGLKITQGSATSTTANKLVDSTANFNSTDHLNKTLYNSTDDTWAKITAIDSTTQVSISADIMASGEAYVIANAVATIQNGINLIPGVVNCTTTVKVSGEAFNETATFRGKKVSGAFSINLQGTIAAAAVTGTATGGGSDADTYYIDDTTKVWGVDAYKSYFVKITAGAGVGDIFLVESNTATRLRIIGNWSATPDGTTIYKIYIPSSSLNNKLVTTTGQADINVNDFIVSNTGVDNLVTIGVLSSITLNQCRIIGRDPSLANAGQINAVKTYFEGDRRIIYSDTPGARATIQFSLIRWSNTVYASAESAVISAAGAFIWLVHGTTVENSRNHGAETYGNGILWHSYTNVVGLRTRIKNSAAWGTLAAEGGQARYCSNSYYNGNVSGTFTGTAGSYGYAS